MSRLPLRPLVLLLLCLLGFNSCGAQAPRKPVKSLACTVEPDLPRKEHKSGRVTYQVHPGATVQIHVKAIYADGSEEDVTGGGIMYMRLSPTLCTVTRDGKVTFTNREGEDEPVVVVGYGSTFEPVGFDLVREK